MVIYLKAIAMIVLVALFILLAGATSEECNARSYPDGIVCVCNATYCDTVPDLDVSSGRFQVYSTSSSRLGFSSQTGTFQDEIDASLITIGFDRSTRHQSIIGFGGAFTDSAGINIKSLPQKVQDKLLESYFSESGIQYSVGRVPIGGTDFSTRGYSYDDVEGDDTLEHFELQQDDLDYKIPYVQRAIELTNGQIKLFGSPWSAPLWMKTSNNWSGVSFLQDKYYQVYADYILKFFEEYAKHNITYWGMTLQNEGINGFIPSAFSKINAMGWLPSQMNRWIAENLGPTIKNSTYSDVKIMLFDDGREAILLLLPLIQNDVTASYADGIAVHWYWNKFFPISTLDLIKPNIEKNNWFVLASEACTGDKLDSSGQGVRKGSWARGVRYIEDIIENLQWGTSGWVDWSIVLNEEGGPTYIDNFVDSPIIVNETLSEFYKQPTFYALGHFSKFIRPDSVRIHSTVSDNNDDLKVVAFLRPDSLIAIVVYNRDTTNVKIQVVNDDSRAAVVEVEAESINTILL